MTKEVGENRAERGRKEKRYESRVLITSVNNVEQSKADRVRSGCAAAAAPLFSAGKSALVQLGAVFYIVCHSIS